MERKAQQDITRKSNVLNYAKEAGNIDRYDPVSVTISA